MHASCVSETHEQGHPLAPNRIIGALNLTKDDAVVDEFIASFRKDVKKLAKLHIPAQAIANEAIDLICTIQAKYNLTCGEKEIEILDYVILDVYALACLLYGAPTAVATAEQVTKYNGLDPLWAEAVLVNIANKGNITWIAPRSNNSFVYPLGSATGNASIKIALMADWGTGMPQALDMLQKIISGFNPDVVMHLGDVYYAGTVDEQEKHQCKPVMDYLPASTRFYTIPGNHDYYSGGAPFFACVDSLRAANRTLQQASFHELEGSDWVMINMDTGEMDSDVFTVSEYHITCLIT